MVGIRPSTGENGGERRRTRGGFQRGFRAWLGVFLLPQTLSGEKNNSGVAANPSWRKQKKQTIPANTKSHVPVVRRTPPLGYVRWPGAGPAKQTVVDAFRRRPRSGPGRPATERAIWGVSAHNGLRPLILIKGERRKSERTNEARRAQTTERATNTKLTQFPHPIGETSQKSF